MMMRDRLVIVGWHLVTIAVKVNASRGGGPDSLGRMRGGARPESQDYHKTGYQREKAAHRGRVLSASAGQGEGGFGAYAHRVRRTDERLGISGRGGSVQDERKAGRQIMAESGLPLWSPQQ
jgi:hypothetical protein